MPDTDAFLRERPRLVALAARVLDDPVEAEDIAQLAWLRLHGAAAPIVDLPAWLTTVTVRLCLDRLKARTPEPVPDAEPEGPAPDPADEVAAAASVAGAVHIVLDRLSPAERVAFVLHDSFGIEFPAIADFLGTTPPAARKLASRARSKVAAPQQQIPTPRPGDAAVVDAFLAAARRGEFERLLELLAPDALIAGDAHAVALGTPARVDGRAAVAAFFNGAASAALPVYVGDRPAAAWFDRGTPRVVFDITVRDGEIRRIDFRADPEVLGGVRRRARADAVTLEGSASSEG